MRPSLRKEESHVEPAHSCTPPGDACSDRFRHGRAGRLGLVWRHRQLAALTDRRSPPSSQRDPGVHFLASADHYDRPFVGWCMRRLATVSVVETSPEPLTEAAGLLARGEAVAVFPEPLEQRQVRTASRARSRDGGDRPRPFSDGIIGLALVSGAPLVPVGIAGTNELQHGNWRRRLNGWRERPWVRISFGPAGCLFAAGDADCRELHRHLFDLTAAAHWQAGIHPSGVTTREHAPPTLAQRDRGGRSERAHDIRSQSSAADRDEDGCARPASRPSDPCGDRVHGGSPACGGALCASARLGRSHELRGE